MAKNRRLYQLNHSMYCCQYHVIWIPKYRGKVMTDKYIKQELKRIIKQICKWKNLELRSWHIGDDHIHLYLIIPPKFSVSYIVQILKGKSSSWIKKKNRKIAKGTFWCRGYFVSTIGINEEAIKKYIEKHDWERVDQGRLF